MFLLSFRETGSDLIACVSNKHPDDADDCISKSHTALASLAQWVVSYGHPCGWGENTANLPSAGTNVASRR